MPEPQEVYIKSFAVLHAATPTLNVRVRVFQTQDLPIWPSSNTEMKDQIYEEDCPECLEYLLQWSSLQFEGVCAALAPWEGPWLCSTTTTHYPTVVENLSAAYSVVGIFASFVVPMLGFILGKTCQARAAAPTTQQAAESKIDLFVENLAPAGKGARSGGTEGLLRTRKKSVPAESPAAGSDDGL